MDPFPIDKKLVQPGRLSLRSVPHGITLSARTVSVPISVTDCITISIGTMGHDDWERLSHEILDRRVTTEKENLQYGTIAPNDGEEKKLQLGTAVLTCLPRSRGDERYPATTGGEWLGSNTLTGSDLFFGMSRFGSHQPSPCYVALPGEKIFARLSRTR
jgi:hypothetical protein